MAISNPIAVTNQPPSPLSVWALLYLFKANWQSNVVVKSAFKTTVQSGLTNSEQRKGLAGRPVRTITVDFAATTIVEAANLRTVARRAGKSASLFPLFSDQSELTASGTAGDTTISLDASNRRFYVGYRLVGVKPNNDLSAATFDVLTVSAVADTNITLSSALVHDFPIGSLVFPLMECQIIYTSTVTPKTDYVFVTTVSMIEAVGNTQLPLSSAINAIPSGIGNYKNYPILPALEDYDSSISLGNSLSGDFSQSGMMNIPTIYGGRASETITLPMVALNRYDAHSLIRFFDSRAGQLYPFFALSPITEYTLLSVSGTTITVSAGGLETGLG